MSDLEYLMARFQKISNRGKIKGAKVCSAINETCGDCLSFYVAIDKKNNIKDVKFEGMGCALSQVTADLLSSHLIGKNIKDIKDMTFEKAIKVVGVSPTPGRAKCIVTSLNALKQLVPKESKKVTPKNSKTKVKVSNIKKSKKGTK
jgi:nitrogen fixation NifU-like protein